jgi:hypothetical protein
LRAGIALRTIWKPSIRIAASSTFRAPAFRRSAPGDAGPEIVRTTPGSRTDSSVISSVIPSVAHTGTPPVGTDAIFKTEAWRALASTAIGVEGISPWTSVAWRRREAVEARVIKLTDFRLVLGKRNWIPHPLDQFGVGDKENIVVVVKGVLDPSLQDLTIAIFI